MLRVRTQTALGADDCKTDSPDSVSERFWSHLQPGVAGQNDPMKKASHDKDRAAYLTNTD